MSALPIFPHRQRLRVVIMERRGGRWATGTGLIATGMIDRDLVMHDSQAQASAAALSLADDRDMLAVLD